MLKLLDLLVLLVQVSSGYTAILLSQLVCCFGLLQPLLYSVSFTIHAGIACLASWPMIGHQVLQLHAGIACLAFLACDWLFPIIWFVTACWDSMSGFLGL